MEDTLLMQAVTIAKAAGEIILDHYRADSYDVSIKDDKSPVTAADLASDRYIKSELHNTKIPIISEESECDPATRRSLKRFWLVDPLDGTKDFISRNGEFTVNIALIEDHSPVLGVIYAPAIDTLYYAQKNGGSYLEMNGSAEKLPFTHREGNVVTISRQHLSHTGREFLALNGITDVEQKGSSLKFGILAEGRATLYPRFEGSMEWDIAAGHIIATEAGCRIVDLVTGREPTYNKESLFNNPFIAFAPHVDYAGLKFPDFLKER